MGDAPTLANVATLASPESRADAPARPSPARWHGPLLAYAVLSLLAWGWLYRFWDMAGDDYLWVSQPGHAGGRFTADYWWSALVDDWARRNGRLTDGAVRLVLRPGPWFFPLFAPLMLTGVGLAAGWLLSSDGTRRLGQARWPIGLLVLPTVFWVTPAMGGDAAFWASGAMNYAWPLLGLLLALGGVAQVAVGVPLSRWVLCALVPVVILTALSTEVVMLVPLACTVAVGLTTQQWRSPGLRTLLVAGALGLALHLVAPGLWRRTDIVTESQDGNALDRVLSAWTRSSYALWDRAWPFWLVVILALVAGAWRLTARARALSLAAAVLLGAHVIAVQAVAARLRPGATMSSSLSAHTPWLLLASLLMLAAFATSALALGMSVRHYGVIPLVAWVATVSSCVVPFTAGAYGARAHLIPAALMALTAASLVLSAAGEVRSPQLAAVVLAALLLPSLLWFDRSRVELSRNHDFIADRVTGPLEAAARGETTAVSLPLTPPYRDQTYNYAFRLPRYDGAFRTYFDLPEDVVLTQAKAGAR